MRFSKSRNSLGLVRKTEWVETRDAKSYETGRLTGQAPAHIPDIPPLQFQNYLWQTVFPAKDCSILKLLLMAKFASQSLFTVMKHTRLCCRSF